MQYTYTKMNLCTHAYVHAYMYSTLPYLCIIDVICVGKDCLHYCQGTGYCTLTGMICVCNYTYLHNSNKREASVQMYKHM